MTATTTVATPSPTIAIIRDGPQNSIIGNRENDENFAHEDDEFLRKVTEIGTKILAGIDYVGGSLAGFFGFTTSRYQFVLDAYERHQEEIAQERAAMERALAQRGEINQFQAETIQDCKINMKNGEIIENKVDHVDVELKHIDARYTI